MVYLLVVSYAAMVVAGLVIGISFDALHLVPTNRTVTVFQDHPQWDYTTFLNIGFLALTAGLGIRFLKTGGMEMLKMMEMAPEEMEQHQEHIDPVCGMMADPASAPSHVHDGKTYYFCSEGCKTSSPTERHKEHPRRPPARRPPAGANEWRVQTFWRRCLRTCRVR